MGRHQPYDGCLKTPFPHHMLRDRNKTELMRACIERLSALVEFFGTPKPVDGGMFDLVLELAHRHERDFLQDRRLSALFAKYAIDPNATEAITRLACSLAFAHVPGFQFQEPQGLARGRFTDLELASLYLAHFSVRSALKGATRRQRARILSDRAELAKFIPTEAAEHVAQILKTRGNTKAGLRGPERAISNTKLRELLRIFDDPLQAIAGADPDPTARQLVGRVWPFLLRDSGAGQSQRQQSINS